MTDKLIVFLRRPVKGKVKSRLAKTLGEDKALDIYRWLLDITGKAIGSLDADIYLYFDSDENSQPAWSEAYQTFNQKGHDLGERMENAFKDISEKGGNAIMIGSDCPEMNETILQKAFSELEENDVVLGPANDGGVYLIGIRGNNLGLLDNVPWESEAVFKSLLENSGRDNASVLNVLTDIDTEEDFKAFEDNFVEFKRKLDYA